MANPRRNFYDDLGLRRGASGMEIEQAYRAFRKKMDDVSAVPDPAREARMRIAYETLSDPAKREAYDTLLAGPSGSGGGSKGGLFAVVGLVVVAAVAGAWFLMRPSAPPPPDANARAVEELTRRAGLAVSRVESTDLNGKSAALGLAFAIAEGNVATACNGIAATNALTLSAQPQPVAVKLSEADEKLGVCKLTASGIGGSALRVAAEEPKAGDTVYLTQRDAAGKVTLLKANVTKVGPSSRGGTVVETSAMVSPDQQGGPVLDPRGQVVAVALAGEVVRVTPEWAARVKAPEPPQPEAAPVAAPATAPAPAAPSAVTKAPIAPALPSAPPPAPAAPAQAAPKSPGSMTPEEVAEDRRRRLEEALNKNIR